MIRTIALTSLILILSAIIAPFSSSETVVEIRIRGYYFTEPATVPFTVVVEPAPHHRALVVEADGDHYFRSSAVPLEGENEKRLHRVEFKSLPAGNYVLRARVLSGRDVVAWDAEPLVVTGGGVER